MEYQESDFERYYRAKSTKEAHRSPFSKDRARVIHSSSFRRLEGKTQLMLAGNDDFSRTRLTHTLEVAQIGRQLAINLGADPDLLDTACLSHDLGHPPFGHLGERTLNRIASNIGGFEGNAQSFRILTRLEPKTFDEENTYGLNLSRRSLNAILKYPWTASNNPNINKKEFRNKFNVYDDDIDIFNWVRDKDTTNKKIFEAELMNYADDIAYCVNDIEDGLVLGATNFKKVRSKHDREEIIELMVEKLGDIYDWEKLSNCYESLNEDGYFDFHYDGSFRSLGKLKNLTAGLIGRFIQKEMSEEAKYELMFLKGISMKYYWPETDKYIELIDLLLESITKELMANSPTPSPLLDKIFIDFWSNAQTESERLRVAIDQVASLTDDSARKLAMKIGG
jgi:dGTPase